MDVCVIKPAPKIKLFSTKKPTSLLLDTIREQFSTLLLEEYSDPFFLSTTLSIFELLHGVLVKYNAENKPVKSDLDNANEEMQNISSRERDCF